MRLVAGSVLLLFSASVEAGWQYDDLSGGMPVSAVEAIAVERGWAKRRSFAFDQHHLSSIFYESPGTEIVANFCFGRLETITFYTTTQPLEVTNIMEAYRLVFGEPLVSEIPARQLYWPMGDSEFSLSFRVSAPREYLAEFAATYTRPNPCLRVPKS